MNTAREMWQSTEPIHAVTYFAPEALASVQSTGTKGFWMGYFGTRAAPLGPVDATIVTALFYNFAPARAERALPDVWTLASPTELLDRRAEGAAAALRSLVDDIDESTRRALPLLEAAARAADCGGRSLALANQLLGPRRDPVERLWQAVTTLREHRGDGHVAALVCAGLDGIEALVMSTASKHLPPGLLRESRGWTEAEWASSESGLRGRGLLDEDGALTEDGRSLMAEIETNTDRAAQQPYRDGLTLEGIELALSVLRSVSTKIVAAGGFPTPNPIGLDPATA